MNGKLLRALVAPILTVISFSGAWAQEYEVPWYAIGGGGQTSAVGGDYELSGTTGQASAGTIAGGDYTLEGGFIPGVGTACTAPSGSPVLTLDRAGTDALLSWSSLADSVAYEVVRGDLEALSTSEGDFSVATEACVESGTGATTTTVPETPASGDAFWMLVRGVACATGSYDSGGPAQQGSRDIGIDASPSGCP